MSEVVTELTRAIGVMFHPETPEPVRQEIDAWLQQWVSSEASLPVACEVLGSESADPKLVFFAAKAVLASLMSSFDKFNPDTVNKLLDVTRARILARRGESSAFDVKALMVLHSWLLLICNDRYGEVFTAFDTPELLLEFLAIYFEELRGDFGTKCFLRMFGHTRKREFALEKVPRVCELLAQTPLSVAWFELFDHVFDWKENPGYFLPFLPRIVEGMEDQACWPKILTICERAIGYDGTDEAQGLTNQFNERVFQIMLGISDKMVESKSLVWNEIFKYNHEFTFSRPEMAHALIQKFLTADIAHMMHEDSLEICTSFSDFITSAQAEPDFVRYRFEYLKAIAELVNHGVITSETKDLAAVHGSVRRVLEKDPEASLRFLAEMPRCNGMVFIAISGRVECEQVYGPILEFVVSQSGLDPTFVINLLKRVLTQDYSYSYGNQILAKAFEMLPVVPFIPAELIKTISVYRNDIIVQNYQQIKEKIIPNLATMSSRDHVMFVLMLWITLSGFEAGAAQSDLELIAQQVVATARAAVATGNERTVGKYLDSLRRLIDGSSQVSNRTANAKEMMLSYFVTLMNGVLETLQPIMGLDSDLVQENFSSVISQAITAEWITTPEIVWKWLHSIFASGLARASHFSVIQHLGVPLPDFAIAAILQVHPNDNEEVISKVFELLRVLMEQHNEYAWQVIPCEYILQFLAADMSKTTAEVIEFLAWIVSKRIRCPDEFIGIAIKGALARFGSLDSTSQMRIVRDLIGAPKAQQLVTCEQLEALIAELYPKVGPMTPKLIESIRAQRFVWIDVRRRLQEHVEFNRS